ncbi:hypothetical protein FB45DRAFT_894473 [Roridomyces roridus]|uniref:F-box domain-containing protein n=1 Tax=Roridomyces roridus TaxID=1738132 RepID=A0AAD7G0Y7_9AGAR|nr:hypothetical protein FB45DRAFT_894473 [Roridomyces roridus]
MSHRRKQRVDVVYLDAVLDIPPELWEIIAASLPRESLAALCLVCRQFCSIISPILYRDLSNPPLNIVQSSQLLETLSKGQTRCCPTPSLLIRKLAFRESRSANQNSKVAIEVLRGLPRGAELRAIHWDSMPGLDDLGRILRDRNHLPNFNELVVKCNGKDVNNFNFIQTRGLQTLELDLRCSIFDIYDDYEIGRKICYKLTEALQILPFSSPLLHTFRFRLALPHCEEFPHEAYSDLVATINESMQFPALKTLELSVNLRDDESFNEFDLYSGNSPSTDFGNFLVANPTLVDLTLSASQTKCPKDVPFLPQLRFFKGTFEFAAALLADPADVEKLDLTFIGSIWADFPILRTPPLPGHPSLTHLRVLAFDLDGKPLKLSGSLASSTFARLASSFRNLMHLDICISGRFKEYQKDLMLLTRLQSLRIQEFRTTPYKLTCNSAQLETIFPPNEYTEAFKQILPYLAELQSIEICILADFREEEYGDMHHEDDLFEPPEMKIDYFFTWTRPLVQEFFVRVNAVSLRK